MLGGSGLVELGRFWVSALEVYTFLGARVLGVEAVINSVNCLQSLLNGLEFAAKRPAPVVSMPSPQKDCTSRRLDCSVPDPFHGGCANSWDFPSPGKSFCKEYSK